MSISDWFSTFNNNIQVKSGATISTRYRAITQRLNTDFWSTSSDTAHSLYVGSYGRNTATEGFSDLDMIMQLPGNLKGQYDLHQGNGQSALLQAVKRSIERTYSGSSLGADGQVVLVQFTDGIVFEVMPAFLNSDNSYTFPDANSGGSWKLTDPRPEIEAIRVRNNLCNGNLVPLCRMMRAWKKMWDVSIGGLLIDTLAYQFIETYEYRDRSFMYYDWLCRDFFGYMAGQDATQNYWRSPGSRQYVWGGGFQYKATRCYNISREAIEHEGAKREWSAKQRWREIFGSTFPD